MDPNLINRTPMSIHACSAVGFILHLAMVTLVVHLYCSNSVIWASFYVAMNSSDISSWVSVIMCWASLAFLAAYLVVKPAFPRAATGMPQLRVYSVPTSTMLALLLIGLTLADEPTAVRLFGIFDGALLNKLILTTREIDFKLRRANYLYNTDPTLLPDLVSYIIVAGEGWNRDRAVKNTFYALAAGVFAFVVSHYFGLWLEP